MINSHEVEDRGVNIVNRGAVYSGVVSYFVCFTIAGASLDAASLAAIEAASLHFHAC